VLLEALEVGAPTVAFFRISASSSVRWSGWVSRALLIVRGLGTAGAAGAGLRRRGSGWLRLVPGSRKGRR